jgi:hypothetical protein
LLATACGGYESPPCEAFARGSVWAFTLASESGERLEGEIRVADSARRVVGTRTAPDGETFVLDYPVENLRVSGDSLHFVFAPADFRVRGRCVDSTRAAVEYAAPMVDAGRPVGGRGEMRRLR